MGMVTLSLQHESKSKQNHVLSPFECSFLVGCVKVSLLRHILELVSRTAWFLIASFKVCTKVFDVFL